MCAMKWRTINFLFPTALSEHQENILIVNCQAIVEETQKQLDAMAGKLDSGTLKAMGKFVPGIEMGRHLAFSRVSQVQLHAQNFFNLNKISASEYEFSYAIEGMNLINATVAKHKIVAGKMFRDILFIDAMRRFVFADMKVESGRVKVETKDVER